MACFDIGISLEGLQTWAEALFSQDAVWSLLYAGVLSGGIAYTLQNLGQQGVHPTIASLLLSLESVFAVLAGWLVLGESLNQRESPGLCADLCSYRHCTGASKEKLLVLLLIGQIEGA